MTGQLKNEKTSERINADNSKRKMIEEILRDSHNNLSIMEKGRPYTPPFTKLVPMSSLRSMDKGSAIIERAKEEILNSEIYVKQAEVKYTENDLKGSTISNVVKAGTRYDNRLLDSLDQSVKLKDNNLDLIYDHVLGCYYDPKTNMYYELKN